MRAAGPTPLRFILASLIGPLRDCGRWLRDAALAADEPRPPVAIQFSLDRPIDAAAAPFVMAAAGGLFSAEGLAVTTNIASGSSDAIARVAAGTSDFALVDINALVRFRDKDKQGVAAGQGGVRAVQQGALRHHRPQEPRHPGAVGYRRQESRRRRGRSFDPAVAGGGQAERHQDSASVKQSSISAAVREPMLSAGQIDAVTGFSYLSAINLKDRGVPADDLAVLKFADYGCEAYGFAVIVNPALAAAKPEAVKGFVRAVIGGMHLAVKDPGRAVAEVVSRMDGGSRDLELERLRAILRDNILTGEVKRNGIGGIDPRQVSSGRSISSRRISSSRSGRRLRIFSTIRSCPRSTAV